MPEFILSDQHLFAFKGETVVPDLVFFYASGQQFSVVMFLIHLRQGSFQGIAQRSFPPGISYFKLQYKSRFSLFERLITS